MTDSAGAAAWIHTAPETGATELHVTADRDHRPPPSVSTEITSVAELVAALATVERVISWDRPEPTAILESPVSELWTGEQCAQHLGIATRTWFSYVQRPAKRNPAPAPARRVGSIPLWYPHEVRTYGRGRRPRSRSDDSGD